MKETKQAAASPEARAAMHEMMAAFEAFKAANDARLDEIEQKASVDTLLEEKVARIDAAVAGAQDRLERLSREARRPGIGELAPSGGFAATSPRGGGLEEKSAWDGPGQEDDDRPLVAVAADPWRPMRVFAGGSAAALTPRAEVAEPATVGVLVEALEPGPLHRWDEMNTVVVRLEGRAPESGDAGAVLAGANTVAVEVGDGWELVQFREATLVDPGVWRLSGLLRGQQGTNGELRAGASVGAQVVVLDRGLARADVASGERGAPLIWRAGPAGSPPGGDAFAEIAAAWLGVQARPWSVAHLKVSASDDGLAIRWVPRARLDGDRWDGDTVAADPERYRVRVFAGAGLLREWEVDDASAVYEQTMIDADFPGGGLPSDAALRVSQWSPRFGWGVEAIMPLA